MPQNQNREAKVGRVSHYYNKIGVAIIDLDLALKVGDVIRFSRGGEDLFQQDVLSMQLEHTFVKEAEAGDSVGIKTIQEIKNGSEVYLVELN